MIYHLSLWLIAISVTASCGAQLAATYWDAPGAEGRENDRVTLLAQASSPKERNAEAKPAAVESSEGAIDEAPLLEFVERHQPSLQKLLRYMKQKQPKQYENALKELSRVKQRLATLEKRDSEGYQIELELWKTRSGLRMLVAEIQAADSSAQEKLKARLHDLVRKEIDLETARFELDKKHYEERLAQVDEQLRERASDPDATVSKAIKVWENRAFKPQKKK